MSDSSSRMCAIHPLVLLLGVDAQLGIHAHKADYFTLKYSQYPLIILMAWHSLRGKR